MSLRDLAQAVLVAVVVGGPAAPSAAQTWLDCTYRGFGATTHKEMRHSVIRLGDTGAAFLIDADLGLFVTAAHVFDGSGGSGTAQPSPFAPVAQVKLHEIARFDGWDVVLAAIAPPNIFADTRPFQISGMNGTRWQNRLLNVKDALDGPVQIAPHRPPDNVALLRLGPDSGGRCVTRHAPKCCDEASCLRFTGDPQPGDSGGPLYNREGVVHGVLTARGRATGYATPLGRIWDELMDIGVDLAGTAAQRPPALDEALHTAFLERLRRFEAGIRRVIAETGDGAIDEGKLSQLAYPQRAGGMSNFAFAVAANQIIAAPDALTGSTYTRTAAARVIACAADDRRLFPVSQTMVDTFDVRLAQTVPPFSGGFRDAVLVAGASSVLPYVGAAAEAFGMSADFPTPMFESGSSGTPQARFCAGVGLGTPDVAVVTRPLREQEIEACAANGVDNIFEAILGYGALAVAAVDGKGPGIGSLDPETLWRAMTAGIPIDGALQTNRSMVWADIDPNLPAEPIAVFLPDRTTDARDIFDERILLLGCEDSGAFDWFYERAGSFEEARRECLLLREDGAVETVPGTQGAILERLSERPGSLGVLDFGFWQQNVDDLDAIALSGVSLSAETVASGEYIASWPIYVYGKRAHIGVIPGLADFIEQLLSDGAAEDGGPLSASGLVPAPDLGRAAERLSTDEPPL